MGRTGTFVALDQLLQQIRHVTEVDIFNLVLTMRDHRTQMVQTEVITLTGYTVQTEIITLTGYTVQTEVITLTGYMLLEYAFLSHTEVRTEVLVCRWNMPIYHTLMMETGVMTAGYVYLYGTQIVHTGVLTERTRVKNAINVLLLITRSYGAPRRYVSRTHVTLMSHTDGVQ